MSDYTELDKFIKRIARPDRNDPFTLSELRESLISARSEVNNLRFELENSNQRKVEYLRREIESLERSSHIVDEIQELKELLGVKEQGR